MGDLFSELDPKVPIRNFRRVTPWLSRGGQPGLEGIQALSQMGVRTVVSLRRGRNAVEAERKHVEAAGMTFVNLALSYWLLPGEQTIATFLELLDDQSKYPIFVHCLHGKDRTGLVVALFRVTRQGWTFEEAYREMKLCGFHRFRVRNFKWLLWHIARKYKSSNA